MRKNLSLKLAILLLLLYVGGGIVHIFFKQFNILDMTIAILVLLTLIIGFVYSIIAFKKNKTRNNTIALVITSVVFLLISLDMVISHVF